MKKLLNKKGYTLIEIILSMSIFSIIFVIIIGVFISFTKIYRKVEFNNINNSNIINVLNYIKYNIDETEYLEIVSKDEIKNNKNKLPYKYIMLDEGNIVLGDLNNKNEFIILNKNQISSNFNLQFKKSNKSPSDLIIEINSQDMNESIISYINIQNMQYNNLTIQGNNGEAIIYKSE
ncbi:prepilin-type N-terminal cleavage/methylation domain-containing protein [[Clostridium] colinum]|uniref:prepilin-type N-terminal cleavage/methylation domain-containing protein n=1 Tax=[Clostridium] colinum TaxID=36835 RepID=UPI0020250A2D|nr:prepilin-type N-terminal cleavage/methylation domain-containing protein [[Clostridium] colinum]